MSSTTSGERTLLEKTLDDMRTHLPPTESDAFLENVRSLLTENFMPRQQQPVLEEAPKDNNLASANEQACC